MTSDTRRPKNRQLELFGRTVEADQTRAELLARLRGENATDLADRLAKCGLNFSLWCKTCGHEHRAAQKCNRKWCPSCAPKRANERAAKLRACILTMRWPLHVTLTLPNVEAGENPKNFVRGTMKAFSRLRRSKLWKANVDGGAAAFEVTNKGNGWHPHIHTVIDCRWLAIKTAEPTARDAPELAKHKMRCAGEELRAAWAVAAQCETPTSNWIRRCDAGAAAEILKYALKSEHIRSIEGRISPILRMLDSCRIVTTFGSLRGLKFETEDENRLVCPAGHAEWTPVPPRSTEPAAGYRRARGLSGSWSSPAEADRMAAAIEREVAEEVLRGLD